MRFDYPHELTRDKLDEYLGWVLDGSELFTETYSNSKNRSITSSNRCVINMICAPERKKEISQAAGFVPVEKYFMKSDDSNELGAISNIRIILDKDLHPNQIKLTYVELEG